LRALDLYCCAGGATRGLQLAGFHVTGIDIKPQPRYCGDAFIQGDCLAPPVNLQSFDFIWASPPCQANTSLKVMWNAREHADLIPQTREILEKSGRSWCMENVPGSSLSGFYLCGSMFGLGVQVYDGWRQLRRHRWFEASFTPLVPPCHHSGATIGFYGDHARDRRRKPGVRDRGVDFADADKLQLGRDAMGMPWADWKGISQAIPPAYSEFIAREFMNWRESTAMEEVSNVA
jgi:DNA (cytosine-5)-methyltransferase 1